MADDKKPEKFSYDEALEADIKNSWDIDKSDEEPAPQDDPKDQKPDPPSEEDPPEPTFEIDGEQVPISEVQKWRKGHLLMDDYTRKTQTVAEERRQLEEERKRLAPLQEIERLVSSSPEVRSVLEQSIQQARQEHPEAFLLPMQPLTPATSPDVEREVNQQLDRDLRLLRYEANNERQQMGLDPLSDEDWDKVSNGVLQAALDNNLLDLNMAYRLSGIRDEWSRAALDASKKASAEQVQERSRQSAGTVMSGSPRAAAPPPNTKPKDIADATRNAYRDLRSSGQRLFTND